MCLSTRLKSIRKNKKISQRKLAASSGVSFAYIQQLEKGERKNPSIDIITKLASALNISINDLLEDTSYSIQDILNDIYDNYSLADLERISGLNTNQISWIFDKYRNKDTSKNIRILGTALNLSDKQIIDWILLNEQKPLLEENTKELQLSFWYSCFFKFPFKNVNVIDLLSLKLPQIKEIVFALNNTFEKKLNEINSKKKK